MKSKYELFETWLNNNINSLPKEMGEIASELGISISTLYNYTKIAKAKGYKIQVKNAWIKEVEL